MASIVSCEDGVGEAFGLDEPKIRARWRRGKDFLDQFFRYSPRAVAHGLLDYLPDMAGQWRAELQCFLAGEVPAIDKITEWIGLVVTLYLPLLREQDEFAQWMAERVKAWPRHP